MAARQGLAVAGLGNEMVRRRTGARGNKIAGAREALDYLKHERVVGGSRGGRRRASGGDQGRRG